MCTREGERERSRLPAKQGVSHIGLGPRTPGSWPGPRADA